jgi:hypothetical protein
MSPVFTCLGFAVSLLTISATSSAKAEISWFFIKINQIPCIISNVFVQKYQ